MLAWFDGLSLRWKLTAVSVLAGAMTLVLASVIMGVYDGRAYRAEKIGNVTAEAKILAASVSASLVFNDADATREYLAALAADPELRAAAIYGADGASVASYLRPGETALPERAAPQGSSLAGDAIAVAMPVMDNNSAIGTVYIRVQIEPMFARFARYAVVLFGIGSLSLAMVLPLSLWLHRMISNPIEELSARNAIINATLDAVDHGVVVADANMNVTFMNDRAAQTFGDGARGLAVGHNVEEFLDGWQKDLGIPEAQRAQDLSHLRNPVGSRGQYLLPGGRAVEYRQSPLPAGGFVRAFTDITEEKALQEQLQSAKEKAEQAATAKAQFLAAMSHEIRTPMNGVIGIVELLRATALNADQTQMVEIIRQSGITLLDVINDILDYSKIEAGRMTVEKTGFALAETIESTAAVIGGNTSSKFLDIVCFVDPNIDDVLVGDPVRIRQVILNLMGNAVKFTQRGTVTLEASVLSVDDREMVVLFEVTDTGEGIAQEKQKQLFQPFTQADYSTTRRFGGTGLGLSISRNLVSLMGGEIGVRSELGRGSTFWFKMPFERLPERVDPFAPYRSVVQGLRFLVCDSITARPPAAAYLRHLGARVIEAPDSADAMRLLREQRRTGQPVDIAIISMRTGDDHSVRLADHIKHDAQIEDTKLLLIVPNLSASSAKLATQAVAFTLTAPIQRGRLYETVAAIVGRRVAGTADRGESAPLRFVAPSIAEAVAGGCLILVAEDNRTNQFVIKSQLQRLGYAAEFVNDGREAWEVLNRDTGRYGMLITDCHMPFVDGYQLTGMIRAMEQGVVDGDARRLPIVALTANALQGEADICRAAGMDGYMFKPTDLPTLDAMVQKWLPKAADLRRPDAPDGAPHATRAAPQGVSASAQSAIDLPRLGKLLGTEDPASLMEMLAAYWASEAATPATLRTLALARDNQALASAAHGAKGAAASICAAGLAELCVALEHSARAEDWAEVDLLAARIDRAFGEVGAFITRAAE